MAFSPTGFSSGFYLVQVSGSYTPPTPRAFDGGSFYSGAFDTAGTPGNVTDPVTIGDLGRGATHVDSRADNVAITDTFRTVKGRRPIADAVAVTDSLTYTKYRLIFQTPTVSEGPAGGDKRLFPRYKLTRGITVVKDQNGNYYQTRFVDGSVYDTAQAVYLGGHVYDVGPAEAAALTTAGYGANVTQLPT